MITSPFDDLLIVAAWETSFTPRWRSNFNERREQQRLQSQKKTASTPA